MIAHLPAPLFFGIAFLRAQHVFGRVYFADLAGSGFCGLLFLGALDWLPPVWLLLLPMGLAILGSLLWFMGTRDTRLGAMVITAGLLSIAAYVMLPDHVQQWLFGHVYRQRWPQRHHA